MRLPVTPHVQRPQEGRRRHVNNPDTPKRSGPRAALRHLRAPLRHFRSNVVAYLALAVAVGERRQLRARGDHKQRHERHDRRMRRQRQQHHAPRQPRTLRA